MYVGGHWYPCCDEVSGRPGVFLICPLTHSTSYLAVFQAQTWMKKEILQEIFGIIFWFQNFYPKIALFALRHRGLLIYRPGCWRRCLRWKEPCSLHIVGNVILTWNNCHPIPLSQYSTPNIYSALSLTFHHFSRSRRILRSKIVQKKQISANFQSCGNFLTWVLYLPQICRSVPAWKHTEVVWIAKEIWSVVWILESNRLNEVEVVPTISAVDLPAPIAPHGWTTCPWRGGKR